MRLRACTEWAVIPTVNFRTFSSPQERSPASWSSHPSLPSNQLPSPRQLLIFLSLKMCLSGYFREVNENEIIRYALFCDFLLSLINSMFSKVINVGVCISTSVFFGQIIFHSWIYHTFCCCLPFFFIRLRFIYNEMYKSCVGIPHFVYLLISQ